MNPVTHFSVPLWTLLFFSALLKVVPTQTIDTECNGTEILSTSQMTQITTMTTTFSLFLNISNCTLYIGNPVNGTTTDLIPGAVYPVYLNCTNCSKQLSSLTKNPATVTGLNITEITTSSLSLSWTKPVGNSSFYKVQWTDDIVSGSLNVSATSTTITNLTAGVRYYINVSAVADDKVTEGQPSSVFQYTKPAVVVNLTVSITASSVFLSWTQPVGNTLFYTVQSTDGSLNMNLNTTQTYVNITGLTPGGQYTFTVRAVAGDQETIGEANAVSLYTKPAVVVNLTVTEFTTSSVFLNWTQPVGNFFSIKSSGLMQV
ncbi:hypothetical protein Q5P01_012238 [Channa striata]|uniref:Fibronectin type-III domain-containing protein n=1 Tax=Channa striata TaxID=64152 RepID=A0AA88MT34_CHASR|nr:hypothetical protein Q5P01_012238 [Channa striata]